MKSKKSTKRNFDTNIRCVWSKSFSEVMFAGKIFHLYGGSNFYFASMLNGIEKLMQIINYKSTQQKKNESTFIPVVILH